MKKRCLVNFLFYFIVLSVLSQTYTNPVLVPGTFGSTTINSLADPHVLKDIDGTYYMYVTGSGYPCFSSRDLVNWTYEKKVFTGTNRKWATNGFWAPEVIRIGSKYYLHYTAGRDDEVKHIGVAVADKPTGPFVDVNDYPFIDHGAKGTIDSHVFVDDDGRTYMYYSNAMSTNPIPEDPSKKRSEIWVVEVTPDLSAQISEHVMLIYPQQSWENNPNSSQYWNEGAVVIKNNGIYYLFFSANCYCAANYAVGYATSTSPMGPFTKYPGNPILSNAGVSAYVSGPGHNCITRSPDNSEWIFVYHSHVNVGNLNSSNNGIREINIDRMTFLPNGTVDVIGPTVTEQPYPLYSGVTQITDRPLQVYPTVVDNHIEIRQGVKTENALLTITSMLGQTFQYPVKSKSTVDISALSAGCYQLTLTDGNEIYNTRIIKR